jgi:predicted nucleotide-binding protein
MNNYISNAGASLSPLKGMELLRRQYKRGKALLAKRPIREDEYKTWEKATQDVLTRIFGVDSVNVNSVMDIGKHDIFPPSATERYWEEHRYSSLDRQLVAIDGIIELLNTEHEVKSGLDKKPSLRDDTVFLVHGHNEGVKDSVARYLERLKLKVIILHEQPNEGRTIIEKFVDFSDVGFAIILLTGDDRGSKLDLPYDKQLPRARQNVILELGYFLGKLGRRRVCALYQPGVEIPSDYQGVLFLILDDAGAWKLQLARELKAAGLPVDLNKAI